MRARMGNIGAEIAATRPRKGKVKAEITDLAKLVQQLKLSAD